MNQHSTVERHNDRNGMKRRNETMKIGAGNARCSKIHIATVPFRTTREMKGKEVEDKSGVEEIREGGESRRERKRETECASQARRH